MDRSQMLKLVEPMLSDFKEDIARLRSVGATQADIEDMLDKFESAYAADDDGEGKLVVTILRQAAQQHS